MVSASHLTYSRIKLVEHEDNVECKGAWIGRPGTIGSNIFCQKACDKDETTSTDETLVCDKSLCACEDHEKLYN